MSRPPKNRSDRERQVAAEREKTGVWTGAYAVNPVNGAKVPIWVADYVLMSYGTGAIMAVPAHDERDHAFALKFNLPIIEVIESPKDHDVQVKAWTGDGPAVNSDQYNGLTVAEFKSTIIDWLEAEGRGTRQVNYKLRDWLFSRQRYWGEPFPWSIPTMDKCFRSLPMNYRSACRTSMPIDPQRMDNLPLA